MRRDIAERLTALEAATQGDAAPPAIYIGDPADAPPGTLAVLPPKDQRPAELTPEEIAAALAARAGAPQPGRPTAEQSSQPEQLRRPATIEAVASHAASQPNPASPAPAPEPRQPRAVGSISTIGGMWPTGRGRLW